MLRKSLKFPSSDDVRSVAGLRGRTGGGLGAGGVLLVDDRGDAHGDAILQAVMSRPARSQRAVVPTCRPVLRRRVSRAALAAGPGAGAIAAALARVRADCRAGMRAAR